MGILDLYDNIMEYNGKSMQEELIGLKKKLDLEDEERDRKICIQQSSNTYYLFSLMIKYINRTDASSFNYFSFFHDREYCQRKIGEKYYFITRDYPVYKYLISCPDTNEIHSGIFNLDTLKDFANKSRINIYVYNNYITLKTKDKRLYKTYYHDNGGSIRTYKPVLKNEYGIYEELELYKYNDIVRKRDLLLHDSIGYITDRDSINHWLSPEEQKQVSCTYIGSLEMKHLWEMSPDEQKSIMESSCSLDKYYNEEEDKDKPDVKILLRRAVEEYHLTKYFSGKID